MAPTAQDIDASAADWVARLDRSALSEGEERALEEWLAADTRHRGAFMRLRAVALQMERAQALGPSYDPSEYQEEIQPAPVPRASRRRLWLSVAATVAVLALTVPLVLFQRAPVYDTRIGEVRVVPLADGSVMTLNTASRVELRFDQASRAVRLLTGEALFDVAKDPTRPFVVEAAGKRVVAVGTRFSVRADDGKLAVIVTEGRVRIESGAPALKHEEVLLSAGHVARESANGALTLQAVEPARIDRELAWRDGRIAFESETLAHAAEAFERYSDIRIVIDDPVVAQQEITGLFTANDPVSFARAAATSLGLQTELRDGEVRISR